MAQRASAIAHPRPNQAVVGILFEDVRDPSRASSDGKDSGGYSARKSEHPRRYRQVEVQVRAQPLALPHRFLDAQGDIEQLAALAAGDSLRVLAEQHGARIAVGIDGVSEARGQPVLPGDRIETVADS